jgi:hypothetical protein
MKFQMIMYSQEKLHFQPERKKKIRYAVVLLVEALRYKPEGHGFDTRRGRWLSQLT